MSAYANCTCHCRACGNLLGGGQCPNPECRKSPLYVPPPKEEEKWLTLGGLIFAVVFALAVMWLFLYKAY